VSDTLSVVSLFSGAGGFDWGFHRAGFETCLANELLKVPAQTLANNLGLKLLTTPASPQIGKQPQVIQGDIAEISFADINGFQPDVLIGGPPCQDFSVVQAHRREGIGGKKGRLYAQFIKAVMILQPKVFVFENVQGLLSANDGEAYNMILNDLTDLSSRQEILDGLNGVRPKYVFNYAILFKGIVDAAKFGVGQSRKRLIIVGLRQDLCGRMRSGLQDRRAWLSAQMDGGTTLTAKFPLTCIEVFEGKPLSELAEEYKEIMQAYRGLWEEDRLPSARLWRDEVWDKLSLRVMDDYLAVNQIQLGEIDPSQFDGAMEEHRSLLEGLGWLNKPLRGLEFKDGTNSLQPESEAVRERMFRIPPGENHEFVVGTPWQVAGKGISFIYRRAFPLKPAPTVVAYGGGGTFGYHYARERSKLTLRERARLQTFTDDFYFTGGVEEIRAQIGEAVPPLMGEKIGYMVREILAEVSGCS
jgi:DNA (cytosine-5)-methyltransferase 1